MGRRHKCRRLREFAAIFQVHFGAAEVLLERPFGSPGTKIEAGAVHSTAAVKTPLGHFRFLHFEQEKGCLESYPRAERLPLYPLQNGRKSGREIRRFWKKS